MMLKQEDLADTIRSAVQSLLTPGWLMPEGGWGSWSGDVPNLWSTAEVLTLLKNSKLRDIGSLLPHQSVQPKNLDTIIQDAVQYIESLGQDGAFNWSTVADGPDPVSSAFALEIFLQQKRQGDQITRCAQYIQRVQAPDGGWDRQVSPQFASSAITTAIVALALNRVQPVGPLTMLRSETLAHAHDFFLNRAIPQDDDTLAWSRAAALPQVRATAWVVYALHAIWHDDVRAIPGAKWLKARQNPNGSWGEWAEGDIEDTP